MSIKVDTMNHNRIFILCFLLLVMLLITQPVCAVSLESINATPLAAKGQFVITDVSPSEGNPGDTQTVTITIKNINQEKSAYAVSTLINPDKVNNIQIEGGTAKFGSDQVMPRDSFSIQYTIAIKESATKGIYYVPVTCIWSIDKAGTMKYQEDLNFGVNVVDNPELLKIDTTTITTDPAIIYPGDVFSLNIKLSNNGNNKISQIRAILDTEKPFSSMGSTAEQYLSSLNPGDNEVVSYNLMVGKQAQSRLYTFNISLQYIDNFNRLQNQQSGFGINVDESSGLNIQDVRLDPTSLYPGTEGLLQVQVANAGTNNVKNVRIPISGGEKILTQSQNFIGILSPGASTAETSSYGILVNREIEPGDYGMNIQINYDDLTDRHFSKSNLYIVKVNEPSSLIPVPPNLWQQIGFTLIFLVVFYGIFLAVGSRIDKTQTQETGEDDERTK